MSNMKKLVDNLEMKLGSFGFLADVASFDISWQDHGFNVGSYPAYEMSYMDWSSDLKSESGRVHFADLINSIACGDVPASLEKYELERALTRVSKECACVESGEVIPTRITIRYKNNRRPDVEVSIWS